jgi:hypothetical protein
MTPSTEPNRINAKHTRFTMAWFSSPESDPKKLRTVIERVWPIVVAYSKTLAPNLGSFGGPYPMSSLPFSKTVISDSLLEWLILLSKPATLRTLKSHLPELIEEVASAETVESLIVQYLSLCYFIPDRDAQIFQQLGTGNITDLAQHEVERFSTIKSGIMYDRGEREDKLKRLGYPTSDH